MTSEEFWDLYINENILDIFDETCEFFSHDLPDGFTDEYDALEIILETAGHNENVKNFDNVIKFIDIVKNINQSFIKRSLFISTRF